MVFNIFNVLEMCIQTEPKIAMYEHETFLSGVKF